MSFGSNEALVTSANVVSLTANGNNGDVYLGTAGADAFVIADGDVGDDSIVGFSFNDILLTGRKLFDGNGDGYIALAANATLNIDRFGAGEARRGNDNIALLGNVDFVPTQLRYLGVKDGSFAYAEAHSRDVLLGHFASGFQSAAGGGDSSTAAQKLHVENDVSDNSFDMSSTSVALLTDNALGLNFGGDTIKNFGDDDLLVFTSKLANRDGSGTITFGANLVLDLSGADGPQSTDGVGGPGGQIAFAEPGLTSVHYLGEKTVSGVSYYFYGTAGSEVPDGVTMP